MVLLASIAGLVAPGTAQTAPPPGYGLELVAPQSTGGQRTQVLGISPDGSAVSLRSLGTFAGAPAQADLGIRYYTERSDAGWATTSIVPPAAAFPTQSQGLRGGIDSTEDQRRALWMVNLPEDKNTSRFTPLLTGVDGTQKIVGPTLVSSTAGGPETFPVGTSADLETIVFESRERGITTDGSMDTRSPTRVGLYVVGPRSGVPGAFSVRQVAYHAGATFAPSCAVNLGGTRGARGSVSANGRQVIFTTSGSALCRAAMNQRVWAWTAGGEVEDLSASQCTALCGSAAAAFFEGASQDGERVFFTTDQKLLDSDLDDSSRADLYLRDSSLSTNRLRAVTSSGGSGQGAGVRGVTHVSRDGTYVYFIANGRPLAGANARGEAPQSGDDNLYVYRQPRTPTNAPGSFTFIGKVSADDVAALQYRLLGAEIRSSVATEDGRFFVFASTANLTPDKLAGDDHRDLYRYDARDDELRRIWTTAPEHNGAERSAGIYEVFGPSHSSFEAGRQQQWRKLWPVSGDGQTVAFATSERLSPEDVNDRNDVYMWQASTGELSLLSSGESIAHATLQGVSIGGDVFFTSDAPLVPEHRSGGEAAFVARKGGGFPVPPGAPLPCTGDGCQGPLTGLPPLGGAMPPTSVFAGPGNEEPAAERPVARLTASGPKSVRGSRVRLRVRSTVAGRVTVRGARLRSSSRMLAAGRRTSIRVSLTTAGRRRLARGRSVRVRAQVRFRAESAGAAARRVTVTFRPTAKQKAKANRAQRTGTGR